MIAAGKWIALLSAALVTTACLAVPAGAVFPGRNGQIIASTWTVGPEMEDVEPNQVFGNTWLAEVGQAPDRLRLRREVLSNLLQGGPVFSPDGKRVAYSAGYDGIYVSRANGSRPRRLTRDLDSAPAWSPQGRALAFTRSGFRNPRGDGLYVVHSNGRGLRRLVPGDINEFAWSPRGDQLAFWPNDGRGGWSGPPPIMLVDLRGRVREIGRGAELGWSSTGWLSYRRDTGLYAARPDGSQERQVADGFDPLGPYSGFGPYPYAGFGSHSWAPDGRRLVFSNRFGVFVADLAADRAPRPIVRHAGANPTFSPDGRLVAWARDLAIGVAPARGGRRRIIRIPRDTPLRKCETCQEWIYAFDWQALTRRR